MSTKINANKPVKAAKKAAKKSPKKAPKKTAKKTAKKAAPKKAAKYTFKKSNDLYLRACQLFPGAIYGHQSPALTVPGSYPYYAVRGEGAYYWDVDGNKYIDYMCGYGPMVTGHNNRVVEEAAAKEAKNGNCFNHPTPLMVKLAERLLDLMDFGDWAVFAKNGSDLTTWSIRVAREATGRRKIAMCRGEYHGTHAWCAPTHGGLLEEDRKHIVYFDWNNLAELRALFDKHPDDIAGVIMTPFHHPAFGDCVMPDPGFWEGVRKLCNDKGAVLVLDDVRAGFRLSMKGSHHYFGFEPDIAVYCKAIANGHPLSAAVGRDSLKLAASNVYLTGSYWNGNVQMAAAMANLDLLEKGKGVEKMLKLGDMLMDGLTERGKAFGYEMVPTGPGSMPFIRFGMEENFMRFQSFCAEMTMRGHFFHPHHNWFLSAAHKESDIKQTLNVSEEAFKAVKKEFGD